MEKATIAELFNISIAAEREAQAFYTALADSFSSYSTAAEFFHSMRLDEETHIDGLLKMRDSLSSDMLEKPIPNQAISLLEAFLTFSASESFSRIKDLEDAYRMTVNLEFSEVNKIHELLVELFAPSDETRKKFFDMLKLHLKKLDSFHKATSETRFRQGILPT